jgi:predicted ATPase/DNA-binding SARP family transcriptional activator
MSSGLEFCLLGPLEVKRDGVVVGLGGARPQGLLAVLLLNANRVVLTERLIDELWGERPPRTARAALQGYVARLRHALGEGSTEVLVTEPGGYRLRVAPGAFDLERFEGLLRAARRAAVDGDHAVACKRLREGLSLWRGPPLADLAFESSAGLEVSRLEEARLDALEERIDADLALGRDAQLVGELQALVAQHPLRERFRAQLMLALYRAGRQADALDAYRDARRVLVEELGIEPGSELRELEHAILAQDPGLRVAEPQRNGSGSEGMALPVVLGSLTELVGRERELRVLGELVDRPEVRLVTLTGPGGIGKTRLALAAVERQAEGFADERVVVLLAGVTDPDLVMLAIARALGVGEQGVEPILERVGGYLAERKLLMLLDNFEQVLDAAPRLPALLARAPGLKLLVTSRALLHVSAEHVFAVGSLQLPDPHDMGNVDGVAECESVRLFVQRASALRSVFTLDQDNAAAVAAICARVDGVPLALELAAARTRVLTPAALLERLTQRLALLTGGPRDAPARQQTLRATLDWSYELLDPPTRELFARLSVFAGGFTLASASSVVRADRAEDDLLEGLSVLVDHSLSQQVGDGRFAMLEIVREYARERLEDRPDAQQTRRRHAEHFVALAEEGHRELRGPGQSAWLDRLELEHDNLRQALAWSLPADPDLGLCLAGALRRFWVMRVHLVEGRRWLDRALAANPRRATFACVQALIGAWDFAKLQGDYAHAGTFADEALEFARQLGDRATLANATNISAMNAMLRGDLELARALYEESTGLARETGDDSQLSTALVNLGDLALYERDYERTLVLCTEAAALCEKRGDRQDAGICLFNLAFASLRLGRHDDSIAYALRGIEASNAVGDQLNVADCLLAAGAILGAGGKPQRAARLVGHSEKIRKRIGGTLDPAEHDLRDEVLGSIQAQLGQESFAACWDQGQTMSLPEALIETRDPHTAPSDPGV